MATATGREEKRSRLGSSIQRAIYKKARGYKHPEYEHLSARARVLNGLQSELTRVELKLDKRAQAAIWQEQKRMEVIARERYDN